MSWRSRLRDALWWGAERIDRAIGDAPAEQPTTRVEQDVESMPLPSSAPPVLTEEAAAMIAPRPKPKEAPKAEPLEGSREATLEARIEQARRRMR